MQRSLAKEYKTYEEAQQDLITFKGWDLDKFEIVERNYDHEPIFYQIIYWVNEDYAQYVREDGFIG